MVKSMIFTDREMEVIDRKVKNKKLSQTDSNYLYRFIKPKLKEMESIDARKMLDKMEYNQKIESIEKKIKKSILENIKEVNAIILYGSIIQNNYKNYNDVDILIVTKTKIYSKPKEKYQKIKEIKKVLGQEGIDADIQIYGKETVREGYSRSPTLIYQLKDHKVIYGNLKVPKEIRLYNIDLKMQLDWSNLNGLSPTGEEVYRALRNVILVRLLSNNIVDNGRLKETLNDELGKNIIERLKNNKASTLEKRFALNFLRELSQKTREELRGELWARKV
jgi:predicted nucleotidyltransferase